MLGWPGYWVLIKERVQLQNQMESLLEEGRIKLSSVISDLLGVSARRILRALADGQTDSGTAWWSAWATSIPGRPTTI